MTAAPDFDHFIAANEYGFYCIPRSFRGRLVPRLLQKGEVYEPATLRFMQRQMGSGDVITGGAFVGDFFPALALALTPGARIHSFEPAPNSLAAARHTLALNHLTCVDLHPVAVGAAEATLPLQVTRKDGALAAGAKLVEGVSEDTIDVPVKTLDSLVPEDRTVTILHLDIEGHELQALQGATRLIRDHAPIIIAEAGKRSRRMAIGTYLRETFPDHGYIATSVVEENCVFLPVAKR